MNLWKRIVCFFIGHRWAICLSVGPSTEVAVVREWHCVRCGKRDSQPVLIVKGEPPDYGQRI